MAYLSIKFAEEVFSVMIKQYNSKEYADFYVWFNKNIALEHEKIACIKVDTTHQLQKK